MTAEEKIIETIRNFLISQDGEKFLKLSKKDQDNIIAAIRIGHIERNGQNERLRQNTI